MTPTARHVADAIVGQGGARRGTVAASRGLPSPPRVGIPRSPQEIETLLKWTKEHAAAVKSGLTGIPSRHVREDTTSLEVTVGTTGGTFDLELADERPQ